MTRNAWLAAALAASVSACATGEGEGSVKSTQLYVENCWNGSFDLRPTFFASDPFEDTQQIRIQRGERMIGVSDGVSFLINDVSKIRANILDKTIGNTLDLGLPVGVRPPGFPLNVDISPPQVSLTLYLNDTCHVQNGALYSVSGSITFTSLFSGNRNENDSEARLTEAKFIAQVTDPRDATFAKGDGGVEVEYVPAHVSEVEGSFRFYFQRGSPAQPFP